MNNSPEIKSDILLICESKTNSGQEVKHPIHKVVGASAIGSFVEWYEFSIYVYLAVVLGTVFFVGTAPEVQLIASLDAFTVAFLARLLGVYFLVGLMTYWP